jgi:hypothetical protein
MLNTQAMGSLNKTSKIQSSQVHQPVQNTQQDINNPAIINNFNIIGGGIDRTTTIIVEHDKINNGYTFKSMDNNILGSFNVLQLFKLLNNECDSYLLDVNIGTSDIIIKKYLYNPDDDKENTCELISHLESPFTGNIDLLVKLYSDITKIEDKINEEILTKPHDIAQSIKDKNNKFIYNILIRILKLSNTLTEHYKHDKSKRELLIRYSVGAAYKLTVMTQDDIQIKKLQYETIQTDIDKLKKIQESINSKLDTLKQNIDVENANIDLLIKQLSAQHIMKGGDKSTNQFNSSNSSNTSKTSKSNSSNQSKPSKSNSSTSTTQTSTNTSNTSSTDISTTNDAKKPHKNITSTTSITSNSTSSTIKKDNNSSDISIYDIQNESHPTENTRSFIKSIELNSSYNTSVDTFTITD